jgi:hypothetical protein
VPHVELVGRLRGACRLSGRYVGITSQPLPLRDLRADCANCFGLCCVAPAFAASSDFAIDKPAGHACPNLTDTFRCGVHSSLRDRGFAGCTVFDCFGAGQQISQHTFAGRDWRTHPDEAGRMFAVFGVMRGLRELLYYLAEALEISRAASLHPQLREARDGIQALANGSPDDLLALDIRPLKAGVGDLLGRASDLARAPARTSARDARTSAPKGAQKRDRRGADLIGAVLTGTDLRGTTLRGAYLIGADLTNADLRDTDLLGTDLRGAKLHGANLQGALFLLQSQLDAATGDASTTLPTTRTHPGHWLH